MKAPSEKNMPDAPSTAQRLPAQERPGDLPERAELVYGALALAGAVLLLVLIPNQTVYKPQWEWSKQPALFSVLSIVGMVVFGILEVIATWPSLRQPNAVAAGPELRRAWLRGLEFAAWFMVYVAWCAWVGYLPATIAFCLALTWRIGYRSARMLGWALGVALFTVLLFKSLLSVKIPAGVWYDHLPDAWASFMIIYL